QFWKDFSVTLNDVKPLTITQVIDALNDQLATFLFPPRADGIDARTCPSCSEGQLSLKLGKFGAFIGCSNYPDCKFTRKLAVETNESGEIEGDAAATSTEPRSLGQDPKTGLNISVRLGPYGPYVQLDPAENTAPEKPAKTAKGKAKE